MKAPILSALIVAGALIAPATAAPTCLFMVDGQRWIDGACEGRTGPQGFTIRKPGGGETAAVHIDVIDSSHGSAVWNGRGGTGRPDQQLGSAERDGMSCWRGSRVRL